MAGERGAEALQTMPIVDVEVPATQTPPPPDPAHWPKDITYRRDAQGNQMKNPPAVLKAQAKGKATPPPVSKKKPPPPAPKYQGIPVKQPPVGPDYAVNPAPAAGAWLNHPPRHRQANRRSRRGKMIMGKVVVPVQAILGSKWRFQDLLFLLCHRRQRREMRRRVRYRRPMKFLCEERRRTAVDSRACTV